MRIYLAGAHRRDDVHSWRYQLTLGRCDRVVAGFWEPSKKAILGQFHYSGPFIPVERIEDPDIPGVRLQENELRCSAIRCSDLVFSWQPDLVALYELGLARGNGVKTSVSGTPGFWEAMKKGAAELNAIGVEFPLTAPAPAAGIIEAVRELKASGHFFNGVWRKMVSRYNNGCVICGEGNEIGEDIMWRKKSADAKGGDVCHVECFVLNAPRHKMSKDLQTVGMDLLRNRVRKLEQENALLLETVRDLA